MPFPVSDFIDIAKDFAAGLLAGMVTDFAVARMGLFKKDLFSI